MQRKDERKENLSDSPRQDKGELDKERPVNGSSDQLLREPNEQQTKIEVTVSIYHRYLRVVNMILILFNVMFTEYLCMLKYSCTADGIEIQAFLSRTIPAFFFVSFFLQAATYIGAIEVRKQWVKWIKFIDGLYFLILFLFAIIAFILSAQVDTNSKNDIWVSLSSLSKDYYNGSVDNLVSSTKENLILTGVFHIIVGFLFLVNAIILWNFDFVMPSNWRPRTRFQLSCEKEYILQESEKQKLFRRKKQKRDEANEGLFDSNLSNPVDVRSSNVGGRFGSVARNSQMSQGAKPMESIQESAQENL